MSRLRSVASRVLFALALLSSAALRAFGPAAQAPQDAGQDPQEQTSQERKQRFTSWMQEFAGKTQVEIASASQAVRVAELVAKPVFRYSDEQRFIPDATLWVWTSDGRPAAFQKVEGNNHGGGRQWTICFASLSEDLVKVTWQGGREFQARKPGVKFAAIPGADPPADKSRARTLQIRELKDRFTARLGPGALKQGGAETRSMPKPLFEYVDPDSKLPLGAIFGMTAKGTNPDLLLLIEARRDDEGKLRWEYALARMTAEPLLVRLDGVEVWSEAASPPNNTEPGNWIYYFLDRDFE